MIILCLHENCGHTRIKHNDHIDYIHDGHLHHAHGDHYDEHVIEVSEKNPDSCNKTQCHRDHEKEGDQKIPHGDHVDYLLKEDFIECTMVIVDDHGPIEVVAFRKLSKNKQFKGYYNSSCNSRLIFSYYL